MTHTTYLYCVLMFLAGQALMLFWFTVPQLKEKCRIANKTFTWQEWWSCDKHLVIGNMVFGAILIMGMDEFITWKPAVMSYIKYFCAIVGAFGPTIVQEKWGSFKKGISKLIDVKTNLADAVTGGTNTVSETIEKAREVTGQDIDVTPKKP